MSEAQACHGPLTPLAHCTAADELYCVCVRTKKHNQLAAILQAGTMLAGCASWHIPGSMQGLMQCSAALTDQHAASQAYSRAAAEVVKVF
jgi:hypothetical protein